MKRLLAWLCRKQRNPGKFDIEIVKPNSLCVIKFLGDDSLIDRVALVTRALTDLSKNFEVVNTTHLIQAGKNGSYTAAVICHIQPYKKIQTSK